MPIAAGLSSSSAFTVCTSILTAHANNLLSELSRQDITNMCVEAERFAGTACGGMD